MGQYLMIQPDGSVQRDKYNNESLNIIKMCWSQATLSGQQPGPSAEYEALRLNRLSLEKLLWLCLLLNKVNLIHISNIPNSQMRSKKIEPVSTKIFMFINSLTRGSWKTSIPSKIITSEGLTCQRSYEDHSRWYHRKQKLVDYHPVLHSK